MMRTCLFLVGCLCLAATACTGGATPPSSSPPADLPVLRSGPYEVTFAPQSGAITAFRLGKRSLFGPPGTGGSTAGVLPENSFDTAALSFFREVLTPGTIVFRSHPDPLSGGELVKTFTFVNDDRGHYLEADYRLFNRGTDTLYAALQEVTRLPRTGTFFFIADSLAADNFTGDWPVRRGVTSVEGKAAPATGRLGIFPRKGRVTYATSGFRLRQLWYLQPLMPAGRPPLALVFADGDPTGRWQLRSPYRKIPPGGYTQLIVAWKPEVLTNTEG